jgi:hypothetical protein
MPEVVASGAQPRGGPQLGFVFAEDGPGCEVVKLSPERTASDARWPAQAFIENDGQLIDVDVR